jgi:NADH-quinone oxidoreductase subunit C
MTAVQPAAWRTAVEAAIADGFGFFDWLGGVDEIGRTDELRVILVLRSMTEAAATRQLDTAVPRSTPQLASIRDLLAGAAWAERETTELFGVEFLGGDRRHLLLDEAFSGNPLRKDEVLAARTGVGWPGGKEPGESDASPSRRRMVPPGVPDPAVWGDRSPDASAPEADEVAASTVGGRVRRRTR